MLHRTEALIAAKNVNERDQTGGQRSDAARPFLFCQARGRPVSDVACKNSHKNLKFCVTGPGRQ